MDARPDSGRHRMARAAYSYVLWHNKYGDFARAKQCAAADLIYLDLDDEADTIETMLDVVRRSGNTDRMIEHYLLAVLDKTTDEVVERITPSRRDVQAVEEGLRTPKPEPVPGPLKEISNELLVGELLRRLKNH